MAAEPVLHLESGAVRRFILRREAPLGARARFPAQHDEGSIQETGTGPQPSSMGEITWSPTSRGVPVRGGGEVPGVSLRSPPAHFCSPKGQVVGGSRARPSETIFCGGTRSGAQTELRPPPARGVVPDGGCLRLNTQRADTEFRSLARLVLAGSRIPDW